MWCPLCYNPPVEPRATTLHKINGTFGPPPLPHYARMSRFCSFAPSSLLWGRWEFTVPIYFVQDCSLLSRLSLDSSRNLFSLIRCVTRSKRCVCRTRTCCVLYHRAPELREDGGPGIKAKSQDFEVFESFVATCTPVAWQFSIVNISVPWNVQAQQALHKVESISSFSQYLLPRKLCKTPVQDIFISGDGNENYTV